MFKNLLFYAVAIAMVSLLTQNGFAQTKSLGIFKGQSDVGPVKLKGNVDYDAKTGTYIVSGSGADVFFTKDELHYVWKKVKGDFILKANGAFIDAETHMYGKFGLMVRKSLDGNSAQVNAVVHGNKLSSLQWRKAAADSTYEQRTDVLTADMLQLERKGNTYIMQLGHAGQPLAPAKKVELDLGDEVYVGLFVCSHVPDKIKKVTFSEVSLTTFKSGK